MYKENKKKLSLREQGLNPITGFPKSKVLGGVRYGLDTLKIPKIRKNKFSN